MKIKEGFLVRKVAEDFVAVPVNNIENNYKYRQGDRL